MLCNKSTRPWRKLGPRLLAHDGLTGLAGLAKNVRCAWDEVLRRENGRLPVLVGHSSGDGLT